MTDRRRLRTLPDPRHLPALRPEYVHVRPALGLGAIDPPPRVLLLYGSLRERSFSRLAVEEAARLLQFFGCETRIFDPFDLPLPDQFSATITRRYTNCASIRFGQRLRSGAAPNGTALSPGS